MTEESIGAPVDVTVVRLTGGDSHIWLDPALHVYVTAMGYPRGIEGQRKALWRDHIARPGWSAFGAVAAVDPARFSGSLLRRSATVHSLQQRRLRHGRIRGGAHTEDVLVGIAYGYRGAPDQWWNQQLRIGMRQAGCPADRAARLLADYFELTELHVHPDAQGRGVGQALLRALLADRTESNVLLSTPEVAGEENRAWSLYRRFGFSDVLRNYTFAGDPRPFAFLGRELPLPVPDPLHPGRPR
ncbi:MAG TPA: N-acetyltransferase [Gordonia sp. (in: high G+C Gram-positive bacteria)]|uniref:GNAT family N-acetyltransferase n=1 Tax=unclassified Gordonia (in: high G+C Gram-positive bacteria) TaxID=2657482 RepID=UPI000FB23155|nr:MULTISPECIES: N-acetyltransferase [unclassified Gordonia (in: high G+C Gram-positive bacteria)]RTL06243.1 MAG: N-acetyltransferase [Acidimicrobiia bacterium]HNP58687.1 N-acetyltransferase [Gordonia sp. (in: high G+C Gram-positive bacteria)]HRC51115.1 N-acetyltransferase [Gordonia sp. (in: high G+C Gram-positive bacteria)]